MLIYVGGNEKLTETLTFLTKIIFIGGYEFKA